MRHRLVCLCLLTAALLAGCTSPKTPTGWDYEQAKPKTTTP